MEIWAFSTFMHACASGCTFLWYLMFTGPHKLLDTEHLNMAAPLYHWAYNITHCLSTDYLQLCSK